MVADDLKPAVGALESDSIYGEQFILNPFRLFTNQTDARGIEFGGATEAAPFRDWRCDDLCNRGCLGFDAEAP